MPGKKKIIKKKTVKKKKPKAVIEPIEGVYGRAIALAADGFRVGDSDIAVGELIKERFPILTDANVQFVLHKGSKQISASFARDSKSIVSLHVKRYNEEIQKLMDKTYGELLDEDHEDEMGENDDAAKWRRKMRIHTLFLAMDVMLQKEKVLQLHSKDTQVRIFNKLNAKVKQKKVMFNLESLSLIEKIEFLQLIEKAKKNENELFSIIASKNQEQVTEDISHEEVVNDNIKQIKIVNQPEVVKPKVKKGLEDVKGTIQQMLARAALKEFQKKGGGKGGPQEIDHTEINQ